MTRAGTAQEGGAAAPESVPPPPSGRPTPGGGLAGRSGGALARVHGVLVLVALAALGYALSLLSGAGSALSEQEVWRGPRGETLFLWVEKPPCWPLGPQVRLVVSSFPMEVDAERFTVTVPGAGARVLPRDWPAIRVGPRGELSRHAHGIECPQGRDVLELGRRVPPATAYGEVRRALLAQDPRLVPAFREEPAAAAAPAPPPAGK